MMATIPIKWSVSGLATELGIDRRTMSKLVARITPCESKTEAHRVSHFYYMADVVNSMMEGAFTQMNDGQTKLDPQQTKAQLDEERRKKVELERMELEGLLCRRDEVYQEVSTMIHAAKSKLLGLPAKCLHQILADPTYEKALPTMQNAIRECIAELSEEIL